MSEEEFEILNDFIGTGIGESYSEDIMKYGYLAEKVPKYIKELEQENHQLKERIEYYYEFDEEFKKEDLPEKLQPYFKNHDCCRYIVEFRKENQQLKENNQAMQEEMARSWEKVDLYKSVLNEVREFIGEPASDFSYDDITHILEILDKVGDK